MIKNRHSLHHRSCRTGKDAIHQILVTFGHVFGLCLTGIDFRIKFSNPVIIQPTVAPVYTNLKIVLRRHFLHFTQQDVIFVRLESPFDKESIYLSRFCRQYLIFDIIGIEIGLHSDLGISHCRYLMPSFAVYQVGIITQRLSSGT